MTSQSSGEQALDISKLERATNLRVPHPPGFPVEVGGVGEVHAAFLNESRTRDPV
jgi:hypothetical protein